MAIFIDDLVSLKTRLKAAWADIHHTVSTNENTGVSDLLIETRSIADDLDKAIKRRTTQAYTVTTEEMTKFLDGVVGCVEADRFAYTALWERNYSKDRLHPNVRWEDDGLMTSCVVGQIEDNPVNVELRIATISGHRILFYNGCSRVVDHDMVRNFLNVALPVTARHADGRINNTDADNFHNVFPHGALRQRVA